MKSRLKRSFPLVFVVVLLLVLIFISLSQKPITFSAAPKVEAEKWEVNPFYNNYIGSGITAVLRITAPLGVKIDLASLPDVGERFYINYAFGGGELEVRERAVRQYSRAGLMVTEVTYTLQYLFPINFYRVFHPKVTDPITIFYEYLYQPPGGKISVVKPGLFVPGLMFYVVRRLEKGDNPTDVLMPPRPWPINLGFFLKISGGLLIFFTILGTLLRGIWRRLRGKKALRGPRPAALSETKAPAPTLRELFEQWEASKDYELFLEAVRLYRKPFIPEGAVNLPANERLWRITTEVLYSGRRWTDQEIEKIFARLLEVSDAPTV